ncbi:hypothetical protein CKF54_05695 [Psittacicella hinzii]|uniref:Sigma E regulatory protein, MucB/RseB n=1 Tax=Psittacicella hinzii TaxID=2028575 RepID=A0A3A1Y782_9GAMM|nr:MucB/RseB C-terminal domain-containing protein [Psittacicella hinzii]RIY31987.1 hypothetical protein CKF54_05695 [Psittacicella hinzii]
MKKRSLYLIALAIVSFYNLSTNSQAATKKQQVTQSQSAVKELIDMSEQIHSLNYTLYFTIYDSSGYTPYKFNNYFVNGVRYAELSNLEGSPYNIYLKGDLMGNASYALKGDTFNILPNIFSTNFTEISQNYMISKVGTTRVADKTAQVYEVTNKYSNLFTYRIALDNATLLPLKTDLLFRDLVTNSYTVLNSYSVIYLELGMDQPALTKIQNGVINTNSIFSSNIDQKLANEFDSIIRLQFLPPGFKLRSNNEVTMIGNSLITSPTATASNSNGPTMIAQTYSDGLFSFTIYVSKEEVNTNDHFYWQQGDTTLYTEDYGNRKLTIVGQIPLALAKGIINSISVNGKAPAQHPEGFGQQINLQN